MYGAVAAIIASLLISRFGPKNKGPDHAVPVICRAIALRLR